ncbi:hypothetical protein KUD11_02860 [Roseovarius sp. LXJ103]|uniref:hypothetical protein n=1 Tax=Roseovarius carneus TaxID=2853164 RepID=UPI000D61C109|nr:hypothetical protein [Roseovarius carneus]MBZ8117581.1 hypothetical protein [Roseovarius carneus]PWE36628.1 hypothetical protein DD563_12080 [Pelagicola sp. LXJ1103]
MTRREPALRYGLLAFLVATSIGFASVNATSLAVIPVIRTMALGALALCAALLLQRRVIRRDTLSALGLIVGVYLIGVTRGLGNLGSIDFLPLVAPSFVLVSIGALVLTNPAGAVSQRSAAKLFVGLSLLVLAFHLATGGLVLAYPPRFEFELETTTGSLLLYSQGISKFYGLSAILSFWLVLNARSVRARIPLVGCFAVFIALALLGGGRGDFLAAMAVIVMMSLAGGPGRKMMGAVLVGVFYFGGVWLMAYFSHDFIALERLWIVFQGLSFSERDILFAEAVDLVLSDTSCLLIGCGYTYFQVHYGYEYAMYPHNIVLEALITWGVPLMLALFALVLRGLAHSDRTSPAFWAGVFFFLIALKSGDLFTAWYALAFVFALAGVGLASLMADFERGPISGQERLG